MYVTGGNLFFLDCHQDVMADLLGAITYFFKSKKNI